MNKARLTCLVRADLQDFNFGSNDKAMLSLWQRQTDELNSTNNPPLVFNSLWPSETI